MGPMKVKDYNSYEIRPNFFNLDTIDILKLKYSLFWGAVLSYAL